MKRGTFSELVVLCFTETIGGRKFNRFSFVSIQVEEINADDGKKYGIKRGAIGRNFEVDDIRMTFWFAVRL